MAGPGAQEVASAGAPVARGGPASPVAGLPAVARAGVARRALGAATLLAAVASCAATRPEVKRLDTSVVTDLSGAWNDTDARLTAEQMIRECFADAWLDGFQQARGRRPAVRVRGVVNKTDEHIDAQVFIKNIERAMVLSARVTVLAQEGSELTSVEGEQLRAASGRQAAGSPAVVGQETGADFVVAVRIASVLDQVEGAQAKLYQVDFELIGSASGEKVWIGEHAIKKLVTQKKKRW